MNSKLHPVAFNRDQLELLLLLARNEMVAQMHGAVTGPLSPKRRTMQVLHSVDTYIGMLDFLRWRSSDMGRAYRALPTGTVIVLMELITGAIVELMDRGTEEQFQRLASDLHLHLQRALLMGTDRVSSLMQFKSAQA